jgi:tetratricopeptide (TPR) repeat protein
LTAANRFEEAETVLRRALDLQEDLVASFPYIPAYRQELASIYNNLGLLLTRTGATQAAEDAYHQAIQLREKLVADFPDMPDYRQKLAETRLNLGILLEPTDPQRAEKFYRDAVDEHEKLVEAFPKVPEYEHALGQSCYYLAKRLMGRNKLAEVRAALDRAIEHEQAALAANPQDPSFLDALRNAYRELADVLTRLGEHANAASAVEELPRLAPDELKEYLRATACLVRCMPLAASDQRQTDADRRRCAEAYAQRAVRQLRRAIDRGLLRDAKTLDWKMFAPLRDRDDFKELRERLENHGKVLLG